MSDQFDIWFVTYGTYAEPDVPQRWIAGPMRLDQAFRQIELLGFGYCAKPARVTAC